MFTDSKIANKVSSNICVSDIRQIKSDQFNNIFKFQKPFKC